MPNRIKPKLSHKLKKWCKFSSRIKVKSCKMRPAYILRPSVPTFSNREHKESFHGNSRFLNLSAIYRHDCIAAFLRDWKVHIFPKRKFIPVN